MSAFSVEFRGIEDAVTCDVAVASSDDATWFPITAKRDLPSAFRLKAISPLSLLGGLYEHFSQAPPPRRQRNAPVGAVACVQSVILERGRLDRVGILFALSTTQ